MLISPIFFTGIVTEDTVSEEALTTTVLWCSLIPTAGYFWLANALGGTAGKRVLGLKVASESDGRPIGLAHGGIRFVVFLVGGVPLCLGWLSALWDPKHRAWHDRVAGAVVVPRRR